MLFRSTLVALALGASSVLAGSDCTAATYEEIQASGLKNAEGKVELRVGRQGLYGKTPEGGCLLLDISPTSAVVQSHPEFYAGILQAITTTVPNLDSLEFLTQRAPASKRVDSAKLLFGRGAGCGDVCDGNFSPTEDCVDNNCRQCKIGINYCNEMFCTFVSFCN